MTTKPPWEVTRWREAHVASKYESPHHIPDLPAGDRPPQDATLPSSYSQPWDGKARPDTNPSFQLRNLPSLTDTYTDGSTFRPKLHERESLSSGHSYDPQTLASTSVTKSSWQDPSYDDNHADERPPSDAPLTLQIPITQSMYKTLRLDLG